MTDAASFTACAELIRIRRSVFPRDYTGEEISTETLLELLECANWAPNHGKTEPWRFKVLTGYAKQRLGAYLSDRYKERTPEEAFSQAKWEKTRIQPQQASAIIAICWHRDPQTKIPEWEEVAAIGAAVQNLWLAATAMGYAGYWSTPATITEDRGFLQLNPQERCLGLFYLGSWEPRDIPATRGALGQKVNWMNR